MKLSTTYYTLPEAVTVPVGKVLNPDTLPQAPQVMTVEYCGHVDKTTIGDSTSYCLHLPNGYISMDSLHTIVDWSYFRCDHLGNNVAVWSATADSTIQRSFYYPSGLPMAISTGQSAQPYKYNGKEFVEMHGYDVYEYGFRGYYATIARFTSIDPLCEQTPWQSPYCYASNNFTGEIDWMGLFGSGGFASGSSGSCHWVAIDVNGIVLDFDLNSPDKGVYLVDDTWDGTYWDILRYVVIGRQVDNYPYAKNHPIGGGIDKSGGGYYNSDFGCWVQYGTRPRQDADLLYHMFHAEPSLVTIALLDFSSSIIKETLKGILWGQHLLHDKTAQAILSKCTKFGTKLLQKAPSIFAYGIVGYDIYSNGPTLHHIGDAVMIALTGYLADIAVSDGIVGLASVLGTGASIAFGVGAIAAEIYETGAALIEITNSINIRYGNYNAMMDIYWNGF